jgi:hypothetical protein
MPDQLGPLEIDCDAPPYTIVQASAAVGIRMPEDVRWCRLRHFLDRHAGWRKVLGLSRPAAESCTCGQALPKLVRYLFTLNTGEEMSYLLGQCRRCRSVFWD